ncbi:MAG TPA: hypothetical protein VGR62_20615 [Candidatus Binatia bacterium]|nr:hypothetical protein [Candidatus Binatia bacterium]
MLVRLVITALVTFLAAQSAHALDITTCGTVVPERTVGVLVADLECIGSGPSITVERAASLNLDGHTLRVLNPPPPPFVTTAVGVQCSGPGPCVIQGPGTIEADHVAVNLLERAALRMSAGVTLRAPVGIYALRERLAVRLSDVVIEYGASAIYAAAGGDSRYRYAPRVLVEDVLLTFAPELGSRNYTTLSAKTLKGTGLTFVGPREETGNRAIEAKAVSLVNLTMVDVTALGCGVTAERVTLRDSVVTGNYEFPSRPCDIAAIRMPRLIGTTCDHSARQTPPFPFDWDVCLSD